MGGEPSTFFPLETQFNFEVFIKQGIFSSLTFSLKGKHLVDVCQNTDSRNWNADFGKYLEKC